MKLKNVMSKHTKAQDLMRESVQKRLREKEEVDRNEPPSKHMYKLKAFQTVSPKIDTHNQTQKGSKEGSVAARQPPLPKKVNTRDRFLLDLSKEENMIDDVLRKSKRTGTETGSGSTHNLLKTIDNYSRQ